MLKSVPMLRMQREEQIVEKRDNPFLTNDIGWHIKVKIFDLSLDEMYVFQIYFYD